MGGFLVRRLAQGAAIVFVVVTVSFALIHAAPGEPFAAVLQDPRVTPELRDALRARYELDRPLFVQYTRFLSRTARGDLGTSFTYQRPVREVLGAAIPNTLLLMSAALLGSFALGIGLGAAQAARPGSWFDRLTDGAAVVVSAIPDFWLALGAILLFAYRWPLAPPGAMTDPVMHDLYSRAGRLIDVLKHLVLPAGTLALVMGAAIARFQRAALLEVLPDDYIRTARAKGVPERRVLYRHALRNAVLPTITLVGLAFPALLGGAVFVETVFAWPGMGRLAVDALATRDYPLVLAAVMVAGAMVAVGGILADMLYAAADPRLRRA
jgi:peptide/nickel transport system permease protein